MGQPGSDTRCQRPTSDSAHTRQLWTFMRSWAGPAKRSHHSHLKSQADERRGTLPFKLPTAPLTSRCGTKAEALTTGPAAPDNPAAPSLSLPLPALPVSQPPPPPATPLPPASPSPSPLFLCPRRPLFLSQAAAATVNLFPSHNRSVIC
jgi:hypothetical protein